MIYENQCAISLYVGHGQVITCSCILWNVIIYPYPRFRLLAPKSLCKEFTEMKMSHFFKTKFWSLVQRHQKFSKSLQIRHNERDVISNHSHLHCLLNCWFRCRSGKTSKLRVTGLCEGNSLVTGEFPAQRASNMENVSIWWHHHGKLMVHQ